MAKETTLTRIDVKALEKAKTIVAKETKYSNVAHMLEILIEQEDRRIKRAEKAQK